MTVKAEPQSPTSTSNQPHQDEQQNVSFSGASNAASPALQRFLPVTQCKHTHYGAQHAFNNVPHSPLSPQHALQSKANTTGMPNGLKRGIESLSGYSMDNVKVHYNSAKPARLQAHAYAQGNEIHLGAGQERHLPHEAWHVVQQKQGRVQPTYQLKGHTPINDENGLEKEADIMGAKAQHLGMTGLTNSALPRMASPASTNGGVFQCQRKIGFELEDANWNSWKKSWVRDPYWRSPTDKRNCRPMTKRERIHQGNGFNLEADEFVGDAGLISDIEFVTAPFPLTNAGRQNLVGAMNGIAAIYDRITPLRGRNHAEGNFIKHDESAFSNNKAMLSLGAARAHLKVQATQGFRLSDIPKAYSALAKPAATSDTPELYAQVQYAVVGDRDATAEVQLNPLREAPERAWIAVDYIIDNMPDAADMEISVEALHDIHGFFTALIAFVNMMKAPLVIQRGAKTFTPMMHRNDFATLFALLPDPFKAVFRTHRQSFTDAVIAGIVNAPGDNMAAYNPVAHRGVNLFDSFILDAGDRRRFLGTDEVPIELPTFVGPTPVSYYVLPPSFTVARWVTEWMNGDHPRDILTKAHFEFAATNAIDLAPVLPAGLQAVQAAMAPATAALIDWGRSTFVNGRAKLAFNYNALAERQKDVLNDYARGLGGLGGATDPDDPRLVLIENRGIAPDITGPEGQEINPLGGGKLDVASARRSVYSYFDGMRGLFGEEE